MTTYNVPSERTSYLGFPLFVTQSWVVVRTPEGRFLDRVRTLPAARALIRGYRKDGLA